YLMDIAIRQLDRWWLAGMPVVDTRPWFPYWVASGGADLINYYLDFGIAAGLGAIILFCLMLVKAFGTLGKSLRHGVYVMGNFNATGVSSYGTPTPSSNYLPQNTSKHIPSSIVADSITLLSNSWQDSYSFSSPFDRAGRDPSETTFRFAAISGNSKDFAPCPSNQSQGTDSGFDCQSGGVHNLLRYLEDWNSTVKSNFSGSIINLYNSVNSNSVFKCCRTVYEPPVRNYVFEESFLDINRIPPGSPFLQSITLTGFERINDD
ncbi:MAG TPA: hypothetical protein PKY82_28940, partial [Pyrinomonadaceae bacterium]|nr:hypothetical protein [Pyrinomonadaceae bacterium]